MHKIDQCLHLMDDIASNYGNILNFSFFWKDIHDFGMCKDEKCDVGRFVKRLIKNIKSSRLVDQKKEFFIHHCLQGEGICFSLLELYLDRNFSADFIECFK